ncbi:MAG: heavy-metal-associated domain-containing protein [Coriobacteriia bacterium]
MNAIHVKTPGLMCDACTALVEKALQGLPGVVAVTATLSAGTTSVLFDESLVDSVTIVDTIREAGFDAMTA